MNAPQPSHRSRWSGRPHPPDGQRSWAGSDWLSYYPDRTRRHLKSISGNLLRPALRQGRGDGLVHLHERAPLAEEADEQPGPRLAARRLNVSISQNYSVTPCSRSCN